MLKIGIAGPIPIRQFAHALDLSGHSGDPLPAGLGGTPVAHLVEAMLRREYQIVVFTLDPGVRSEVILNGPGIRFCIAPYRTTHRARDFFSAERSWLRQAIAREKPALLHAHWTSEFAMAALDSGRPTLVTAHDAPWRVLRFAPDPYRFIRLLMAWKVARRTAHLSAVSSHVADHFHRYFGYRRPIPVVPNPLPEGIFQLSDCAAPRPPEAPFTVATALSGWCRLKNGPGALRAFALVRKELPQARLLMFGQDYAPSGPAANWARKKRLARGVEFAGALPNRDLLRRLRQEAQVLLHPSREESFGMTVAEAMALGMAVVGGHSSGAVPWLLENGRVGVLVDVQAPARVADALLRLARDPAGREQLGRAARTSAYRFHSDAVLDQYAALYEQILRSPLHADACCDFEISLQ